MFELLVKMRLSIRNMEILRAQARTRKTNLAALIVKIINDHINQLIATGEINPADFDHVQP